MKKQVLSLCFIIFILILSHNALAEIIILQKPDVGYYQNNRIATSAIIGSEAEQSIFSINLVCPTKTTEYYSTPVESGTAKISVPAFLITNAFSGNCHLIYQLRDTEGNFLETVLSGEFKIVKRLNLSVNINKNEYLPAEDVLITGTTSNSEEKVIIIELLKENNSIKRITTSVRDRIDVVLSLPEDISKQAVIRISVNDGLRNIEKEFNINIKSVPKKIIISTNKNEIKPKELIEITASVFDQASVVMEETPKITITNPAGKIIISEESKEIRHEIGQFFTPGLYKIKATMENIEAEKTFAVPIVKLIEIRNEKDGNITIANSGNVLYKEEEPLNLTSSENNYLVTISLSVNPNEILTLNMADFVPGGVYNITLKDKTITNVAIGNDQRSTIKKLSQTIQKITGAGIIDTTAISPAIFFLIIISCAAFLTLYFTQKKMKESALNIIRHISERQQSKISVLQENARKYKLQNKKIREIFSRYYGTDILNEKKIGTQNKEITVLFTDIRGFAALFDRMGEKEIATILNMYFKRANEIIKSNGGFINKFIGDSVMALFNTPKEQPEHLIKAIRSAIQIRSEIAILNEKMKARNVSPIEVGIGIDSGIAAVGNLGSVEKTEYTAIGIPVNVAFRLQALGKGTQILITEKVYEKVKDKIKAESIGIFELKNISKPVKVFNVLEVV